MKKTRSLSTLTSTLTRWHALQKQTNESWKEVTKILPNVTQEEALAVAGALGTAKAPAQEVKTRRARTKKGVGFGHPDYSPLVDRLKAALGDHTMKVRDLMGLLQKKGLAPQSRNPSAYVAATLSSNPEIFERVGFGTYRVKRKRAAATATTADRSVPKGSGAYQFAAWAVSQDPKVKDPLSLADVPKAMQEARSDFRRRSKANRSKIVASVRPH